MMNDNVDKDDLFGQSMAAEIKEFPEIEEALIKNESQEIIFKYQLAKYNQGAHGDAPQFFKFYGLTTKLNI